MKQDHTIILSSHVLSEISAVCDRVVIISKGEIRAVDTIDHLEERADTNPILHLKVKGGSQEVAATMRQVDGVRNVSNISRFKTGIYTYDVELQSSDIRNSLLAALLVKKFDVLEVKEQKKNLEQVFVKLVNQSSSSEQRSSMQALLKELEADDTEQESTDKQDDSNHHPHTDQ